VEDPATPPLSKFAIVLKRISPEILLLIDSIPTMTAVVTTAFWSMTINNPDETSIALVRNGYPDYCREIVHTFEEGKEGTPHIQAWIKLQRQQRLSFVKKLFPRGHFKPLTSAEYVHNTKLYAQKNDETTRSAHVHVFHDPTGTIEALIPKVIERMNSEFEQVEERDIARSLAEQEMVKENYRLAKIFVSASYRAMWKQFGSAMMTCVVSNAHTHTHTHTDDLFSQSVNIPTALHANEDSTDPEGSDADEDGESQGEDHSDVECSDDEADSEGGDSQSSEADDC